MGKTFTRQNKRTRSSSYASNMPKPCFADVSPRRRVCTGVVKELQISRRPSCTRGRVPRRRVCPASQASPPPSLPSSPLTVSAVGRRFCPGVSGRWSGSNSCVIVLYFEAERGTADIEERLELSQVKVRGFEHPGGMLL
nr:uncharacterized protein LOC109193957 isoform X2 [Ipomoea batatas]